MATHRVTPLVDMSLASPRPLTHAIVSPFISGLLACGFTELQLFKDKKPCTLSGLCGLLICIERCVYDGQRIMFCLYGVQIFPQSRFL